MEKRFVANLQPGESVCSEFLVTEKSLAPFTQPNRAGEQFLRMQLCDITGTIRAVAWEKGAELAARFEVGDIIRVRADVGNYRGPQLVVHGLEVLPADQIERRHFQPTAPRDRKEMITELEHLLSYVTEPHLQKLMEAFFRDETFLEHFTHAPAARTVHHNYLGGLLEHSLEVANLCRHYGATYPGLDLPLVICGALLHDVGKIEEYDKDSLSFELTTRGKLLGHIIIGKEMLDKRVAEIEGFPEHLHMELAHMILSHHGQKDWGSPEVPRTFPAFALHYADLSSARLNQFSLLAGKSSDEHGWTAWDRLLERDVYVGIAE